MHFTVSGTDKVKCSMSSSEAAYHHAKKMKEHLNSRYLWTDSLP
jgi:hypothetical protein